MILPIYDIEVHINNKRVPTETVADLHKVHDFLGKFLTWLDSAPDLSGIDNTGSIDVLTAEAQTESPKSETSQDHILYVPTDIPSEPVKRTTVDYAVLALGFLGGSASYSETVNKALELGWQTRATVRKNIARTFEVMARQRGDLIHVGKGVMRLTPEGQSVFEKERKSAPFNEFAIAPASQRYPSANELEDNNLAGATSDSEVVRRGFGKRAIDILVLALLEAGKPIGYSDAPELVLRYGWNVQATSTNPKLMVISKARKYPELVITDDGRFWLTDKGREHGRRVREQLAANESAASSEEPELFNTEAY